MTRQRLGVMRPGPRIASSLIVTELHRLNNCGPWNITVQWKHLKNSV
jgi:hypothetical protein